MFPVEPTAAAPVRGPNAELPPPAWKNHSARFSAEWDATRVIVTAQGELDASNAGQLADYFDLCIEHSTPMVLDLSYLKFFGTAGFSALHIINVKCAGAGLRWAMVPGKSVSRLLSICDPDHSLPVIRSVQAMPDADGDDPDHNRLFQLVP